MLMGVIVDVVGERDERSRANNAVASACVDCGAGVILMTGTPAGDARHMVAGIGFKAQASLIVNLTIGLADKSWNLPSRRRMDPVRAGCTRSGDVVTSAVSKRSRDAGINLQNVTTAISFLTQRTAEQLENITIMCDGQQVHECTDSEQMVALLQSGRAVFGVSVGSLWKQIRETLAHEEYVDLTTMPSMMGGNRPVDDITAMRMRKNFEAQHQTRAAASL